MLIFRRSSRDSFRKRIFFLAVLAAAVQKIYVEVRLVFAKSYIVVVINDTQFIYLLIISYTAISCRKTKVITVFIF